MFSMQDERSAGHVAMGRQADVVVIHAHMWDVLPTITVPTLLITGDREARIRDERPVDVRMTIHPVQRQVNREVEQHLER